MLLTSALLAGDERLYLRETIGHDGSQSRHYPRQSQNMKLHGHGRPRAKGWGNSGLANWQSFPLRRLRLRDLGAAEPRKLAKLHQPVAVLVVVLEHSDGLRVVDVRAGYGLFR